MFYSSIFLFVFVFCSSSVIAKKGKKGKKVRKKVKKKIKDVKKKAEELVGKLQKSSGVGSCATLRINPSYCQENKNAGVIGVNLRHGFSKKVAICFDISSDFLSKEGGNAILGVDLGFGSENYLEMSLGFAKKEFDSQIANASKACGCSIGVRNSSIVKLPEKLKAGGSLRFGARSVELDKKNFFVGVGVGLTYTDRHVVELSGKKFYGMSVVEDDSIALMYKCKPEPIGCEFELSSKSDGSNWKNKIGFYLKYKWDVV